MTDPIRFVDLPAQYADIEDDILASLRDLIHRGAFVGGEALSQFEARLAEFTGVAWAVGCSDGTSALMLAMRAAGLRPGDGVVVPANSFIASANSVVHAGGTPVLVDCDPQTFLIDLNMTEAELKAGRARFIMPVHLYGNPCPMDDLLALADRYHAIVIEDNAQAIGATYKGKRTGSFGRAAATSFYPAKNLGCFGQGGAVVTDDKDLAQTVRTYVEQGQGSRRYYHDVIGYNARLHSMQACVLSKLLGKVDGFSSRRLQVADEYAVRLSADRLQKRTTGAVPVYHLFEYRCDSASHRQRLADAMQAANIPFAFHYPVPIHKQKAYPAFNSLRLPVAERLADTLISLPMHPGLTSADIERVCSVVLAAS